MRFRTLLALVLSITVFAAACSSDDTADEDAAAPTTAPEAGDDDSAERDVDEVDDTADESTTTSEAPADEPDPVAAIMPEVTAAVTGSDVTLTWEAVEGLRWEVQRDSSVLDRLAGNEFTDTDLDDGAYRYQVVAIGTEGDQISSDVLIVQIGDVDTIAPPHPTDVALEVADDQIVVTWTEPAVVDDIRGYLVHRDRVFIAYIDDGTEYVDTDIEPGRAYNYRIRSQDDAGNVSEPEAARSDGDTDVTPPTTPEGATITVEDGEVVITWEEATDDEGIWGYLIHRDGEFVLWTGLDTEFREPAPIDGSSPVYVVRSQDFTGNYSEPTAGLTLDG